MSYARNGMTAIEIMVVVSVATLLATMGTVSTLPALRKGRLNQSVTEIREVCEAARRLARLGARTPATASSYYGVRLERDATGCTASVIWGSSAMAAIPSVRLSPLIDVVVDGTALNGQLEWRYDYGSGFPYDPVTRTARGIGSGPGGQPASLVLQVRSGRPAVAVAIYEVGLISTQEL
ncbi:MAG: type II secretion system protein [Planctomycetes bacterium]|nr:type II secretion system protein [Planctomycetota bacterium]